MTAERRHLKLGFSIWATGFHPAGWRLPEARADSTFDPAFMRDMALLAEKGKLDFFFIGDRVVGLPETQALHPNLVTRPEALTLASWISAVTSRIGVVTTVNTTYSDPFNVARATATIDHMSGGRLALNIVTGRDPEAALNFGRSEHWGTNHRFDNAHEFVQILKGLWDSWEDDALVGDKASGLFVDAAKVHRLDYVGEHFQVAGPLNIERPPQGQIPLLTAGASDRSKDFGAEFADVRFGTALHIEAAKAYYADIKGRLAQFGRHPDEQALVNGIAVYVGRTTEDAHRKYREIQNLSVTEDNLAPLGAALGLDLDGIDQQTPLEEIESRLGVATEGARRILFQARDSFGTERLTLRDLYLYFRRSGGGAEIVGDAGKIADVFEEWFVERATDGFILFPPYLPGTAELFVELVVPELQRRGLFRTEYEERTFRGLFGLKKPANVFAGQDKAARRTAAPALSAARAAGVA
jgi:FMN-dependent oxidoreductase (nitrilotriacetate monooxygenase family)